VTTLSGRDGWRARDGVSEHFPPALDFYSRLQRALACFRRLYCNYGFCRRGEIRRDKDDGRICWGKKRAPYENVVPHSGWTRRKWRRDCTAQRLTSLYALPFARIRRRRGGRRRRVRVVYLYNEPEGVGGGNGHEKYPRRNSPTVANQTPKLATYTTIYTYWNRIPQRVWKEADMCIHARRAHLSQTR